MDNSLELKIHVKCLFLKKKGMEIKKKHKTEIREQEAENRKQRTGSIEQEAENRKQRTGSREKKA